MSALSTYAYPDDLAPFVLDHLLGDGVPCNRSTLEHVLSVAYQASMLREEERPLAFRLLMAPPEALPVAGTPPYGHHRLLFDEPRPLDEQEVRRVSPAAKMQRAMIGAYGDSPESVRIWGLVQTGPGWLHAIQGGRERIAPLPRALSIAVTGPGRLLVSYGDVTIAKLSGGRIVGRMPDVFASRWLLEACSENRRDVVAESERAIGPSAGSMHELLRVLDLQLVRRIIANIRLSRHGGTVVILPTDVAAVLATSAAPIALKYRFADEEPRRRYRSLQLRLMARLGGAHAPSGSAPTWEGYVASTDPEVVAIDLALLELAHTIAALADVDGVVVLNKRFEVLGFGGEIVGGLPEVTRVMHALDPEGESCEPEGTDRVGTRHRSLYRLAAAIPSTVGFVVSQDGGVRLVANRQGAVTYWDKLGTGPMEI